MEASASQVTQFGDCARQWYYIRVLGLERPETGSLTALGSVWHYAVDVYETYGYDIELARKTFVYYWDHPNELGIKIDFWHNRTNKEGLRKRGLKMLDQYHAIAPWKTGALVGTEIKFDVPLGTHRYRGAIDKLYMRKGKKTLEVVDFKTGSKVPEKLRYNLQFTGYLYATERPEFWVDVPGFEDGYERFKGWNRNGWWFHARNNKMFNAGKRTETDYKRLLLAVDEMERTHEAGAYPLTISGESCGWCPFVDGICGGEVGDPLKVENQNKVSEKG